MLLSCVLLAMESVLKELILGIFLIHIMRMMTINVLLTQATKDEMRKLCRLWQQKTWSHLLIIQSYGHWNFIIRIDNGFRTYGIFAWTALRHWKKRRGEISVWKIGEDAMKKYINFIHSFCPIQMGQFAFKREKKKKKRKATWMLSPQPKLTTNHKLPGTNIKC